MTKSEETGVVLDNLFEDLADKNGVLKDDVQANLPVLEKPGNAETKVISGTKPKAPIDVSGQINTIPGVLSRGFPHGRLMDDKPHVLKCNHCKRPQLKHAMPAHIERCLNKKQEKQRKKKEAKDARDAAARKEKGELDDDEDEDGTGKKTASKTGGLTASKKRKALDEAEEGAAGPSKKKKKKDEKGKGARPKAPVDVEKQCGVELPQGGQCARSLTCKSHSMGAKRAVPGRSAPYDKLLADYQRKNQAKLQKAAFDANAPDPEEERGENGPIDSDEEKESVMNAIAANWGGAPLYEAPLVPLRKRYEYNRIRGMASSISSLKAGISPFGNSNISNPGIFGGAGASSSKAAPAEAEKERTGPMVDENGILHPARKGSVVPGARSMVAPAGPSGSAGGARKGSVAAGR
ncbi:SCA7-domain-containing protein [Teratosphaeria nubilosa]|uniref:SCA7-domain-containing protein n=1 Tax=Teratosphaeria nubilosa TaxID=161662 RepID=A0A6G1L134_9PEZI|nr:SCA7-domain-containing protein [Teratosphaeria nubilosa]